jgi:hypothetical protein
VVLIHCTALSVCLGWGWGGDGLMGLWFREDSLDVGYKEGGGWEEIG